MYKKFASLVLAMEVFFGVGESAGQDRCLWQNEARRRVVWLIQIPALPSLKTSVSFPKTVWEKPLGERVALSRKVT